jgi:hypothetical protein
MSNQQETEDLQFDLYNRFYRNELYTELEDYITQMRKMFGVERGGEYVRLRNVLPDINTNKVVVALEIMRHLKPIAENPHFKLDCL